MPDLPTRVEYFQIGVDDLISRSETRPPGQRITAETVTTEGSDVNIVTAGASAMAEEATRQLARKIAALFLDTAEDEELDRFVADRFSPSLVRKQATPSIGTEDFFRTSGPLAAGSVPAGFRIRSNGGVEFRTRFAASFSAGQLGPVSVEIEATEAGIATNVDDGTITELVDTAFDPAIQGTNPERTAGGDDIETDARLRERARNFYLTARRGTLAAIEFGALQVGGVRLATAEELVDSAGDPTGHVLLYIADAQGQANAALAAAVRGNLLEFRGAGVVVDVLATTPVYVPIRYRLRFAAGTNSTEAFATIQNGTLARVNTLAPSAVLPVSLLFTIARSVPGVIVLDDAIVEPVGDLVPAPGTTIRTRLDLITAE